MRPRSAPVRAAHSPCAARARATAASTCSAPSGASSASSAPVAGLVALRVSPARHVSAVARAFARCVSACASSLSLPSTYAVMEPRARPPRERARHRPKSRFQQSVLVAEVMRDQSGRDPGTPRDLREGRADVADFGETVDRDLDELDPPGLLSLVVRGGGAVMHEFLERG